MKDCFDGVSTRVRGVVYDPVPAPIIRDQAPRDASEAF
jgi:hypothetical protein